MKVVQRGITVFNYSRLELISQTSSLQFVSSQTSEWKRRKPFLRLSLGICNFSMHHFSNVKSSFFKWWNKILKWIWSKQSPFFGVPHLAHFFFSFILNEPGFGTRIEPYLDFTAFTSGILLARIWTHDLSIVNRDILLLYPWDLAIYLCILKHLKEYNGKILFFNSWSHSHQTFFNSLYLNFYSDWMFLTREKNVFTMIWPSLIEKNEKIFFSKEKVW